MPPRYYLGLCAIAKDETPFLREWVAYHYYLGFEKIYIYDNESTIPVRDSVCEFYDLGVCDTYTLQGSAMQLIAYNLCLRDHGHEFEWLAFFDLDEFLCLKQDTDARVLLRDYEHYSGLAVNWDMFCSSGHISRPEGLVTKNYRQSLGYSLHTKSIVRPAKVKMPFTAHDFLYHEGIAVNANTQPAFGAYAPVAADTVCLNHYSFRSQQDYEEKLQKGDATFGELNPRKLSVFYQQAAAQSIERADILPVAVAVERMLKEGPLHRRHEVTLEEANELPLPKILSLLGKFMRLNKPPMAEVLFALCYSRFCHEPAFLQLGCSLCLQVGKRERAMTLAKELLTLKADSDSYFMYMECLAALSCKEEAIRIGAFLLNLGELKKDDSLRQRVTAFAEKHSLDLTLVTALAITKPQNDEGKNIPL